MKRKKHKTSADKGSPGREGRNPQDCQQVALLDYASLKDASSAGERVGHTDQIGRIVTGVSGLVEHRP